MAADYTRTIVFKVQDQAIKRATDRITRSLERIEKTLERIERKGFGKVAKEAEVAAKGVDKLSKSVSKYNGFLRASDQLLTTRQGKNILGLGVLGGAVGINEIVRGMKSLGVQIQNAGNAFNPFSKNIEIATVKSGLLSTKLHALAALVAGHPVAAGAAAVAYMAFGDAMWKAANHGAVALIEKVGRLGKEAAMTALSWLKLNKEVERFNKGSVLRGVLRSKAARRGSGFSGWSADVGEYNPYSLGLGHTRRDPNTGEMVHARRAYGPIPASPYGIESKFDNATQKAIARNAKKHLPKIDKSTAKAAAILSQQSAQKLLGPVAGPHGFSAAQYGPAQASWTQRLGFGKKAHPTGMFASSSGMGGRLKGGIGSALIGGGFPMLFGQGPIAATGGALGGFGGGMLGGMFGFGGSLMGTLIGSRVQEVLDFRKEISELNKEMKLMGIDAGFSAKQITNLGKSLGVTKREALEIAKGFKRYGAKQGGLFAEFFGDAQLFEATAGAIDIQSAMAAIKAHQKDMTIEEEARYRISLLTKGVEATISALVEKRIKRLRDDFERRQKEEIQRLNQLNPLDRRTVGFVTRQNQKDELEKQIEKERELLDNFRMQRDEMKEMALVAEQTAQSINTAIESVEKELRKLTNPQYQIVQLANSIGSSFSESFKGIVKGSMTAQQALANLFERTADMFIDMAAQILQAQIKYRILGIFAGSFTSGSLGSGGRGGTGTGPYGRDFDDPMYGIPPKAEGGPVTGGNPYVVGEKGPELFVPNSSGNIIPNGSYGGVGSVVVNVDASGSEVQGDEEDAAALGRMIGAAVQAELIRQKRPGGILAR